MEYLSDEYTADSDIWVIKFGGDVYLNPLAYRNAAGISFFISS
jgi:hypothetical protein